VANPKRAMMKVLPEQVQVRDKDASGFGATID